MGIRTPDLLLCHASAACDQPHSRPTNRTAPGCDHGGPPAAQTKSAALAAHRVGLEQRETLPDAMKERSLPLPGGCWKVQSVRLHQTREAPMETAYDGRQVVGRSEEHTSELQSP